MILRPVIRPRSVLRTTSLVYFKPTKNIPLEFGDQGSELITCMAWISEQ